MTTKRHRRMAPRNRAEDDRLIGMLVRAVHLAYYLNETNDKYGNVDTVVSRLGERWCKENGVDADGVGTLHNFIMDIGPDLTVTNFKAFINATGRYTRSLYRR